MTRTSPRSTASWPTTCLRAVQGAAGSDIGKATVVLEIVVAGGLGGLVYLAISLALRIPELTTIVRLMSDALPRPGRP